MSPNETTVWHAINPNWGMGEHVSFTNEHFKLVAIIENCADIEAAFFLTNHVNCSWWENDNVELVGEPNQRSTSTGDVVVMGGKIFRCEMAGWKEIT